MAYILFYMALLYYQYLYNVCIVFPTYSIILFTKELNINQCQSGINLLESKEPQSFIKGRLQSLM